MLILLAGLLVLGADQLSKTWIRTHLALGQTFFEIGFFRITRLHNTGAAFGLFQGQSLLLTVIALFGVAAILIYGLVIYRRFPLLNGWLTRLGLGLVLGGTAGNLTDRFRFGSVTDFIDFTYWPAFNVADASVTVGVILFAYSVLRMTGKHQDAEGN